MVKIHWGYCIDNEGKDNEKIVVLVSTSLEGLEAQAEYGNLRLMGEDCASIEDIESVEEEMISDLNYRKLAKKMGTLVDNLTQQEIDGLVKQI